MSTTPSIEELVNKITGQYLSLLGERRKLTKEEERRLATANKMRLKASRLYAQAANLDREANNLEPQDMYPNSRYPLVITSETLISSTDNRFVIPQWNIVRAEDLAEERTGE